LQEAKSGWEMGQDGWLMKFLVGELACLGGVKLYTDYKSDLSLF
jgi:hypothetical protein